MRKPVMMTPISARPGCDAEGGDESMTQEMLDLGLPGPTLTVVPGESDQPAALSDVEDPHRLEEPVTEELTPRCWGSRRGPRRHRGAVRQAQAVFAGRGWRPERGPRRGGVAAAGHRGR